MRTIVTGGAGFIGSHLVDALVATDADVCVVDDLSAGDQRRVHPGACFRKMDLATSGGAAALLALSRRWQPEVIYHLAAQVSVTRSVANPHFDAQVNIFGTLNVLEAARRCGARVVLASSGGAVYGPASKPLVVGDPCRPQSPYGASKRAAEVFVRMAAGLDGLPHSILRLANVYGPRQDSRGEGGVVAIFAATDDPVIYGDGGQTRDFVYVGDVAEAFRQVGVAARRGTWNIATGEETSISELAGLFGHAPRHEPERPGEVRRSVLDIGWTIRDLGWKPEVYLADGVRLVQGWVKDGEPVR
jgi:UDP-glucose 4-epimerase